MTDPRPHLSANNDRSNLDRFDDLLADRALGALSDAEATELKALLQAAGTTDNLETDLAAAALDQALNPSFYAQASDVRLPASLLAQLDREADAWSAGVKSGERSVLARISSTGAETLSDALSSKPVRTANVMGRRYFREWSGWIAAAAVVSFGVFVYFSQRATPSQGLETYTAGIVPQQAREQIEKLTGNLRTSALARLERFFSDPASKLMVVPVSTARPETGTDLTLGQIIWNKTDGTGVVTIDGLPPAPAGSQYQIWIYDAQRNERYPVPAGTITEGSNSSTILAPIDPSVPVTEATRFAVTLERTGGEVVSDGSRVVGIGIPQAGEGMAPPPVFQDR